MLELQIFGIWVVLVLMMFQIKWFRDSFERESEIHLEQSRIHQKNLIDELKIQNEVLWELEKAKKEDLI